MKLIRLLLAISVLLGAATASTVSGTVKDSAGNNLPNASVSFIHKNCGTEITTTMTANGSAVLSGTVTGDNTCSDPSSAYYRVIIVNATSTLQWIRSYHINDPTFDIGVASQLTSIPVPVIQLSGSVAKNQLPAVMVATDQVNTYTPGLKQIFGANATFAGLGFAGVVADPLTLTAGDAWYRTDLFRYRVFNGTGTHSLAYTDDALSIPGNNCSANQFGNGINSSGTLLCAQPTFANLSGSASSGQIPNNAANTTGSAASLLGAVSGATGIETATDTWEFKRTGANHQIMRWYWTFTDASNYARVVVNSAATSSTSMLYECLGTGPCNLNFDIGMGSGTTGNTWLLTSGARRFGVCTSASGGSSAPYVCPANDASYDIGAGNSAFRNLTISAAYMTRLTNEGTTGTGTNLLVKLTGAPSTAIKTATTDTGGIIGICQQNCLTTSTGAIAQAGVASCVFDGATTAGDYVQNSSTTAGDCHDAGATFPVSGQVIGRVLSTNGAGGTYSVVLQILQLPPSPTFTDLTVNQAANGDNLLFGKRVTDSSPTGNLLYFKNAANNADLFKLDVAGVMTHSNNVLFGTDNSFDIGATGATRPRNIYVGTSFVVPVSPAVGIQADGAPTTGLVFFTTGLLGQVGGTAQWFTGSTAAQAFQLGSGGALGWAAAGAGSGSNDVNLIRDGAAGVLKLFQTATTDAKYRVYSANAGYAEYGAISELITLSTVGATTDSAANLLPANAIIGPVDCRVTTTITTATNWSVGDATIAARFSAANSTLTAGTTSVGLQHVDQTGTSGPKQTAAAKLRITTTGTPGAGVVRCVVHYTLGSAPTS
jgi:hypothetical protein